MKCFCLNLFRDLSFIFFHQAGDEKYVMNAGGKGEESDGCIDGREEKAVAEDGGEKN